MLRALLLALVISTTLPTLVSAQSPDASLDAEAHALFEAGRAAFAAGRFPDALGDFQRSYELSHRPALLYNIGQCQDRLRHDAEALAAFEQFVAAEPDSPSRAEVESRITFLRDALAQAEASRASEATPPEDEEEEEHQEQVVLAPSPAPVDEGPGAAPWIVVGVGAAALIGGIVLVVVGLDQVSRVENPGANATYASVRDIDQQAPILTGVGWALLGVGAAAVVSGVVWGAVAGGGHSETVALRVGPGSLSLSGTF